MEKEKRKPWMKWYPSDWRGDPKLRMCGLAGRGLWTEICMLMHEADPYGHLVINGVVPTPAQLANLVGAAEVEVALLLAELKGAGVCSVTAEGVIFSRRMVRDRLRSEQGAEHVAMRPDIAGTNGQASRVPSSPPSRPASRGASPQRLDTRNQNYKFTGRVIRITAEQFDKWRESYSKIADLTAALQKRDDWLATGATEAQRRRWFVSTSNWLHNLNVDSGETVSVRPARAPI